MRALEIAPGLAVLCAVYALALPLRNLRWVALAGMIAAAGLAAVWFGWGLRLASVYDRAAVALGLMCGGGALGFGLAVRGLVLWRGWRPLVVEAAGALAVMLAGLWVFDGL